MADTGCPPLIVEGDWSPAQNKTMKNKLQLYFQSKKKSGGGDCRVEAEDGAPRAEVYFISEEGESLDQDQAAEQVTAQLSEGNSHYIRLFTGLKFQTETGLQ